MNDISIFQYVPVFAGKSVDDKKIVIYRDVDHPQELHIRIDDGELRVLSPGSEITSSFDNLNDTTIIHVVSLEWTGDAVGTKRDTIEEEAIRR